MNNWWNKSNLRSAIHTLLFALLFTPQALLAQAAIPQPVIGPRLNPMAVSNTQVQDNHRIYNEYIVPALPLPAQEADINDQGRQQEDPGRGIREKPEKSATGSGLSLRHVDHVCNDFDQDDKWASSHNAQFDIWSESYGGWHPFAFDDNVFYHAENVIFAREHAVGPGNRYGPDQSSFKIASGQPYAAGIGSPLITATPGALIEVTVNYLIFDHDFQGQDYDWVSLGVKPNAAEPAIRYVNGYKRGEWSAVRQQIRVGQSGKIMILLQAHSPAALNSNIYFDDLTVQVNGVYLLDCTEELP